MLTYVARRVLYMVIIMLAVSIVAFIIIQLPPGDYLTVVIQTLKTRGVQVDAAMIRALETHYGLNLPGTPSTSSGCGTCSRATSAGPFNGTSRSSI